MHNNPKCKWKLLINVLSSHFTPILVLNWHCQLVLSHVMCHELSLACAYYIMCSFLKAYMTSHLDDNLNSCSQGGTTCEKLRFSYFFSFFSPHSMKNYFTNSCHIMGWQVSKPFTIKQILCFINSKKQSEFHFELFTTW
jgi:hypothetical protein